MSHKLFITFPFSILDDSIARIFELGDLSKFTSCCFKRNTNKRFFQRSQFDAFVSPYFGYRRKFRIHVSNIQRYRNLIYLSGGNDSSDSKNLLFKAIEKHYPHLIPKYRKFFPKNIKCQNTIRTHFAIKRLSYVLNTNYKRAFFRTD